MRIKLSDEQVDSVVIAELKRHSKILKANIDTLKRRKNLERFEKEDLKRFRQVLDAASVVVDYYSLSEY